MILLVPVSYFFNQPRSEIWRLDTASGQITLWLSLPPSRCPVRGKGITTLARSATAVNKAHDTIQWLACDFNTVMGLSAAGKVLLRYFDQQNNDLHHLSVAGGKVYIANTGRDCIDVLDNNLVRVARYDGVDSPTLQQRLAGEQQIDCDYYDKADCGLPFYQRRVKDRWHFNHILALSDHQPKQQEQLWGGHLLATSFSHKALVSVPTMTVISEPLEHFPHDGILWHNRLWITTVAGRLYCAKPGLPLIFTLVFDLFAVAEYKGWCRGLLFVGSKVYIGITAIFECNSRTAWLDVPAEQTRSGIYQVCTLDWQIEAFFDFSNADGARIFSFVAEVMDA